MLRFTGISLRTRTAVMEYYVTSAEANRIVDFAINKYKIKEELYADGRRHLGTEFSKIYKALYPQILKAEDMMYLEATPKIKQALEKYEIPYNVKGLTLKDEGPKYIQLISYKVLSIYLGKLNLSDEIINMVISCIKPVQFAVLDCMCVAGNKPVDIQGKPLVKVMKSAIANKEIAAKEIIKHTDEGLKVKIPKSAKMEYVKTGLYIRKDMYITLKAIAANDRKPMYRVLEDLLLNKTPNDLDILEMN